MTIYVDADACPVVSIIERIARAKEIPVMLLCDTNHILQSDYSDIKMIGAGPDAVDLALVNMCTKHDIVVTQDYGVAAMALGKGAYAIHQSGKWYTDENIDQMLMERHLNKKARRASGKNHIKSSRKRTQEDNTSFAQSFEKLIKMAMHENFGKEKPKTIDEYIMCQDEEKQADLSLVRQVLRQALPEAEERISWSMPTYWKNHNILHFAASKKHIGLYPGPEAVMEFKEELGKYSVDKGTIRIPYGSVDTELVKKIALWCWNTGNHA